MKKYCQGLAFILLSITSVYAYSWGATGHKLICGMAYHLLNKQQQTSIDNIVRNYRTPDGRSFKYFSQTCIFADIARRKAREGTTGWTQFERFEDWHFWNIPRHVKSLQSKHCKENCVLSGMAYHTDKFLSSPKGSKQRAEALFFLAHWVADAHQPMHISFADDRGGNNINVSRSINMHSLWDRVVVEKFIGKRKWWILAEHMAKDISTTQIQQWQQPAPLQWAAESYAITLAPETKYCSFKTTLLGASCQPNNNPRITESDKQRFSVIAKTRVQQSAVRLAQLLNQLL